MEENTQEKSLIKKESFFGKVKNFFKNLFKKKDKNVSENVVTENNNSEKENSNFKENIKVAEVEDPEEIKLIELQKRYRRGEIAESDLTEEQIEALSELYDKQINALRRIIEEKEKQIAESQKQKIEKKNA